MKRLVYLLSLGVFLSACGEGSIRSIDSDLFFSQENPFQPVITIQGENPITIERTYAWNEPGVFAQSYREGNISNRIQVSSNVNFNKIGSYQIVYSVSDSQGRTSSATRQVIVNDTILPTVTINDAGLGASPSYNKNTPRSILISDSSEDAIKYQAVVVASNNCSSADFANAPQKNISEPFELNPNVGLNKVCVRGIDEAGNIQATPTDSMILEIQNPSLSISLNPTSPTNQTSVTVTANGQGIHFFKVIRRQGEQTCDGLTESDFSMADEVSISATEFFPGLTEGVHRFCAIGRNALGDYDLTQVAEATLEVDSLPPTIEISEPSVEQVNQGDPVTYTVTYSGHSEINLNAGHVTLNRTQSANCSVDSVTGSGNQRTVTLSNCTDNGTVGITIAPDSARDAAGNQAASATSTPFIVDNEGPTIVIFANGISYNPSNGAVTVPLELCQNLTLTATADDQDITELPSFDVSKTGSSLRTITAEDALGNITTVDLALNISLPEAYSHNGIFHRVQNWPDLTGDRNLFLCNDLSFEGDDSFAGIDTYNSIFEGNEKVISDLDTSLFGNLGGNSQVRNLVLKHLVADLTSENAGGLANLNEGLIEQVGLRGAVLSISDDGENSFFGGLVGMNDGEVINSYFEGEIQNPTEQTAGLVGRNLDLIESSYSSTHVSEDSSSRALSLVFESPEGDVIGSYWNCGEDSCFNGEDESAGTALSSSQMENSESFIGFDFETIWKMFGSNSDYLYPVLQFE